MTQSMMPSTVSLQIVSRPSIRLCGKRFQTTIHTAKEDVKTFQDGLMGHLNQKKTRYGVCWITNAQKGQLDYCYAADKQDADLSEQFEETVLPAGLYAEYSVSSAEDLHHLYTYLYNKLLASHQASDDLPHYEVYPPQGQIKLYVPIVSS